MIYSVVRRSMLLVVLAASLGVGASRPLYDKRSFASLEKTPRGGEVKAAAVPRNPIASVEKEIKISLSVAVTTGILLAFNSGFINGACLSGGVAPDGTKQAVAAVTGAWTTSALGYATRNMDQFKHQTGMILSYAGGSAIAGFMNPYPTAFTLSSSCAPAFLLGAALLYLSSSLASDASPGTFSFFYLAAIANGIQNSITSVHTGNLVRSAHYSGMTSDMGTFFGQVLRGNKANIMRLKVCLGLALAFWTGGYLSYNVTKEFASSTLLFSAALYALIGVGLFALKM